MTEIIVSVAIGTIVGYGIKYRLCPRDIQQLESRAKNDYTRVTKENELLKRENAMLKSPKRLINEYQGGEGSATAELLANMREKLVFLEDRKESLEGEVKELQRHKKELAIEVETFESMLNSKLQKEYDYAIDMLRKELEKARTLDTHSKDRAMNKLEEKRNAIANMPKDQNNGK